MTFKTTLSVLAICTAMPAAADCEKIVFSDVGWTDITAITAMTSMMLDSLGYDTETLLLSVPVTYSSMASGESSPSRTFAAIARTASTISAREP